MITEDYWLQRSLGLTCYIEVAAKPEVLEGFRHARARMRPAWCYLIGIRATDAFGMRARAARVASWDRNVEHVLGVL